MKIYRVKTQTLEMLHNLGVEELITQLAIRPCLFLLNFLHSSKSAVGVTLRQPQHRKCEMDSLQQSAWRAKSIVLISYWDLCKITHAQGTFTDFVSSHGCSHVIIGTNAILIRTSSVFATWRYYNIVKA